MGGTGKRNWFKSWDLPANTGWAAGSQDGVWVGDTVPGTGHGRGQGWEARENRSLYLSVGSMHLDFSAPCFPQQVAWAWYRGPQNIGWRRLLYFANFQHILRKESFLKQPFPFQIGEIREGTPEASSGWFPIPLRVTFSIRGYVDGVRSQGCPKLHVGLFLPPPPSLSPPPSPQPRRCRGWKLCLGVFFPPQGWMLLTWLCLAKNVGGVLSLSAPPLSLSSLAQPVLGITQAHAASLGVMERRRWARSKCRSLGFFTALTGRNLGEAPCWKRKELPIWAFTSEISRAHHCLSSHTKAHTQGKMVSPEHRSFSLSEWFLWLKTGWQMESQGAGSAF